MCIDLSDGNKSKDKKQKQNIEDVVETPIKLETQVKPKDKKTKTDIAVAGSQSLVTNEANDKKRRTDIESTTNSQTQVQVPRTPEVAKRKRDIEDSNKEQAKHEQPASGTPERVEDSHKAKRPRISPLRLSISMIGFEIPKIAALKRNDGGGLAGRKLRGWDGDWETEGGSEKEVPGEREAFPLYGKSSSVYILVIMDGWMMTDFMIDEEYAMSLIRAMEKTGN